MATFNTNATATWVTQASNAGLAQAYSTVNAGGAQYNALASNAEANQAALLHNAQVGYTGSSVSFGSGTPVLPVAVHGTAPQELVSDGAAPSAFIESVPTLSKGETGPSLSGDLRLAPGNVQAPSTAALPGASFQPASAPSVVIGQVTVGPAAGQSGPAFQVPSAPSMGTVTAQLVGVLNYGAETGDSGLALITSGQALGAGGNGG